MRRAVTARREGFTLVELLLVLAILGLMYSLAATSFAGTERMGLDSEANRLQRTLRALQHQALLRRGPTGLRLDGESYQAMAFDSLRGDWSELEGRSFKRRDLSAAGFSLSLLPIAGERQVAPTTRGGASPQIILVAAGIGDPFALRLSSRQQPELTVTLFGDGAGQVARR